MHGTFTPCPERAVGEDRAMTSKGPKTNPFRTLGSWVSGSKPAILAGTWLDERRKPDDRRNDGRI